MVTNVDLVVLESGMTAVVGGVGEGKTFLMNLLSDRKSDYEVGERVITRITSHIRD